MIWPMVTYGPWKRFIGLHFGLRRSFRGGQQDESLGIYDAQDILVAGYFVGIGRILRMIWPMVTYGVWKRLVALHIEEKLRRRVATQMPPPIVSSVLFSTATTFTPCRRRQSVLLFICFKCGEKGLIIDLYPFCQVNTITSNYGNEDIEGIEVETKDAEKELASALLSDDVYISVLLMHQTSLKRAHSDWRSQEIFRTMVICYGWCCS